MSAFQYTFTVFTPTYNRKDILPKAYEALKAQTFRDFEWLIVDDGSTDGTQDLIKGWELEAAIPIHYVWQQNAGKHIAINRGILEARGEFVLFLDSDDVYIPKALERYKFHWDSIPEDRKASFSAVSSLVQDWDGNLNGSPFPYSPMDSDSLEIRYKYKVTGEKRGFQRTEVLKQFLYPQFEGENILPDSLLWYRIALHYKTRYVNEVLYIYSPASNALSSNWHKSRAKNPRGTRFYYLELLHMNYPFTLRTVFRDYANYVRFSFHGGIGIWDQLKDIPSPLYCLIAFPVGVAAFLRDCWMMGAAQQSKKVL